MMIPLKKPNLRRCFNFPVTATYDKYVSFLENFAPCISGFLSGILFQGFCSVIINGLGRIGRLVLRHYLSNRPDNVEIVAAK